MTFKSRKLFIWLVSSAAVFAAFLLYSLLSRTPQIEIDIGSKAANTDSNLSGEVGVVGEVGIGPVETAKFTTLNKAKQVEREFGFEKLLHKSGNEWMIEKPFMNIYRPSFKYYITADEGNIEVEMAAGKTNPRDAKLSGNVVIHIVPEKNSKMGEGFIYLDDITYISEQSQFSTDGPVKYVSANAKMLATGMELVYNEELGQLDFLRIIKLESLHITSSQASLFSSQRPVNAAQANIEIQKSGTPETTSKAETPPAANKEPTEQTTGRKYRCLFSKNVLVNHPEQLIFTDELFIDNISEPNGPNSPSTEAAPSAAEAGQTPADVNRQVTAAEPNRFEQQDKSAPDIVVTCDNGIFITPMSSTRVYGSTVEPPVTESTIKTWKTLIDSNSIDVNHRGTFVAQRIDYNYGTSSGETVASGQSELMFYTHDMAGPNNASGGPNTVPVTVTTEKKATFLPAENRAVFEGDCVCTMFRTETGIEQRYTLSAPRLTVNLYRDKRKGSGGGVNAIEHLTADNGVVQLANAKWKPPANAKKLLGFIKLKCRRFDYDPLGQLFLATGPDGLIAADHSKLFPQTKQRKKAQKFSLSQPCYAVLRDFDTLKYHLDTDYLVADSNLGQMLIDYFPVVDGKEGEHVEGGTSHVEADFYETAEKKLELATLSAASGVSYREKEKNRQFAGSKLFYNASKSLMTILGNQTQPCLYNGVHVDQIEYNLQSDTVKTKITGPGQLQ